MMRVSFLWLGATALSTVVRGQATPSTGQTLFTNTIRLLFDTDGNQIDADGSKINNFDGKYYLYGNSFSTTGVAFGIKSYSSNDLTNWAYEGFLYDLNSSNPCNAGNGGCGRVSMLLYLILSRVTGRRYGSTVIFQLLLPNTPHS